MMHESVAYFLLCHTVISFPGQALMKFTSAVNFASSFIYKVLQGFLKRLWVATCVSVETHNVVRRGK